MRVSTLAVLIAMTLFSAQVFAQKKDRNTMVRDDRARVLDDGFWIYNDIDKGLAQAKSTGKPLLVVFRCIPCEACAQLDEEVVENNPSVRKWLSKFVCVRSVYANGMDLSRFQFDYDQSWAAFFMNGDGTIYGRYGTRSHRSESADDVTLEGFLSTMNEVLALHERFDEVKSNLVAKLGEPSPVARPEEFPSLKEKYTANLNYEGEVARSCIHCHQVGDAFHEWYRGGDNPTPAKQLFPYPHPKILGLVMDPKSAIRIAKVESDSWGAVAGFRAGDLVREFGGQPIVSMADMQWVLHNANDSAEIAAVVERDGNKHSLILKLPSGWRETGDISWRATSWPLRRMVTGGLGLRSLTTEEAKALGQPTGVNLSVKTVGQFNDHAAGKRAGFKADDIITKIDGKAEPMTESQVFAHLLRTKKPGDSIEVEVLRDGKLRKMQLPIQK